MSSGSRYTTRFSTCAGGRSYPTAQVHTQIEDALAFLLRCSAEEFFDFIELSFKVEIAWRVMSEENQVVEALNEIFRIDVKDAGRNNPSRQGPLSADLERM